MSFIFVAAAGASAIISKEIATWTDRMKQKRRTGSMGLFTKDDLVRNAAGDVGMVPVAGAFAEKAINDAAFDEYSDGSPRDTGTWAGAGIDAGMDLVKLASMGSAYGAEQAAAEGVKAAGSEIIPEAITAAADAAVKEAPRSIVNWTQDAVAGVGDAFGAARDFARDPLVDNLGDVAGDMVFNVGGQSAFGAATNPENPGQGAAMGAASGMFNSFGNSLADQLPGGANVQKAFSKPISQATRAIGRPVTGMIGAALQTPNPQNELNVFSAAPQQPAYYNDPNEPLPDPFADQPKDPSGDSLFNSPYGLRRPRYGTIGI